MVYKFRVILDAEEDIFRDIAILADDLEDLQCNLQFLWFDGMEVASFTLVKTWNQEDEISFFDTGDVVGAKNNELLPVVRSITENTNHYVYDFINMWTFLVELAAVEEQEGNLS
jgi:hypothetical protein